MKVEESYSGVNYSNIRSNAGSIVSLSSFKRNEISDDIINLDISRWSGEAASSFSNTMNEIDSMIRILEGNIQTVKGIITCAVNLTSSVEGLDALIEIYEEAIGKLNYCKQQMKSDGDNINEITGKINSINSDIELIEREYEMELDGCHEYIDSAKGLDSSFIALNTSGSSLSSVFRSSKNPYLFVERDSNGNILSYYELNTIKINGEKKVVDGLDFYIKYDINKIKKAFTGCSKCKLVTALEDFFSTGDVTKIKNVNKTSRKYFGAAMKEIVMDTLDYNECASLSVPDRAAIVSTIISNNSIYNFPYYRNGDGNIEVGYFDCDTYVGGCYNIAGGVSVPTGGKKRTIAAYIGGKEIGNFGVRNELTTSTIIRRGDVIFRSKPSLHAAMIVGQYEENGKKYYIVSEEANKGSGAILKVYDSSWNEWTKDSKNSAHFSGDDYSIIHDNVNLESKEDFDKLKGSI